MTAILFDGSEKGSHRVLLEGMGVTRFAMSYWRLRQRGLPKKGYLISNYFQPEAEVYVDSGWMQAQEKLGEEELLNYVQEFEEFLENNHMRICGFTELHLDKLGMDWIHQWRADHEGLADIMWPVWLPTEGQPMLNRLAQEWDNVYVTHESAEDPVTRPRLNALSRQYQTSFHSTTANPDTLRDAPLETASTISWASPQMRGETIVWDGTRLVRYQAKQKDQARSRYKAVIERAGLDYQKVLADDATEVTKLAIWSYQQLETSMDKTPRHPFTVIDGEGGGDIDVTERAKRLTQANAENQGGVVATRDSEVRNGVLARATPRDASEKRTLPVVGVEVTQSIEVENGREVIRDTPVLRSSTGSLRQCNTCVLSANCPAFKPDSECAFSLPVEIRTKDQLKSMLTSIMEIQGQRVFFARFAEELNGGYPDPNVSAEIDRMFKLTKVMKDLESNNEFVRLTVERQQSGGVLSAIFGDRANALKEIEQPLQGDAVIQQIFDPE